MILIGMDRDTQIWSLHWTRPVKFTPTPMHVPFYDQNQGLLFLEQWISPTLWVQIFNHKKIKHGNNIIIINNIIFTGKYCLHTGKHIIVLIEDGRWDIIHCFFRYQWRKNFTNSSLLYIKTVCSWLHIHYMIVIHYYILIG